MPATLPVNAEPMSDDVAAGIIETFHRDGFAYLPGVLTDQEVQALRARVDHVFDNPEKYADNLLHDMTAVRLFETDQLFRDMLVREPLIGLVERLLGPTCHLIANNVVRNGPGKGITKLHVDELMEFPIGEGMTRHDARLTMPVQRLTVQIMLSDVATEEDGPTQYVPGSHYAGWVPERTEQNPVFEGRGLVSLFCKAGDAYLHNGQCWHRGALNKSNRHRYLLQQSYGQRYISQRFYPYLNYRMPDHVIDGADERLLRVLGKHDRGSYG